MGWLLLNNNLFNEYYDKYKPLIKKISYNSKVNSYTKEDIEQELLMVLYKCIQNYDKKKGTKFITYFQSSCYYHIVKLRKENRFYPIPLDDVELIVDISDNFDNSTSKNNMKFVVNEALEKVKFGDFIKMYYIYNIPIKRIAEIEGVSKQYISFSIKKGLEELKSYLQNEVDF